MKKSVILVCLLIVALVFTMTASAAKVTTIKYVRWAGTQEAQDFQTLVNKFMKANPDIKVETEFLPWSAYWDKLKTTIMSGTAADVLSFSHQQSAPYVCKEALYDMGKLPGAKELLNQMQPGTKLAVLYKGKIYGMPVGVGVRALIYNKEMFDEAGVPYPNSTKPMSLAEFMAISKKLTKVNADGKVTQYAALFTPNEYWENMVVGAGGHFVDNYTKPTKVTINTPEGIAGFQAYVDLIKEKVSPPFSDQWNGPWGSPDSAVATKKVAMMCSGPWALGPLKDGNIKFGTAPIFVNKVRATRGYINFLAIAKNSKNPKAAWKFIQWMTSTGQVEFTKTGDLPANTKALAAVMKEPAQWPKEIMDAYYSELPYVITGPMVPSDEFSTVTQEIIDNLLMLRITPQEATKQMEDKLNVLIKKIYAQ
jgi:multiple sugar transport system substrate-binding protein